MFGFYDKTMVILIPALIISAWAQLKVSSTFNKFSNVRSINGYTGAQVARMLLDSEGLYDIPVQERSEEHTSELQSRQYLVCRLLLEKKQIHSSGRLPGKPYNHPT